MNFKELNRWPLLLTGLTVIGIAVGLFGDSEDPSDARALLLGLGCVLLGAGIQRLVTGGEPHDPNTGGPDPPNM